VSTEAVQRTDLVVERGASLTIELGPITTEQYDGTRTPEDLTAGGTKMWLTVKFDVDDVDGSAVIQLTELAGIALNSPVTTAKNMATATIPKTTFVAAGFDVRKVLHWDAWFERGARHEQIARGKLTVVPAVTRA
jgi:hypothetical protein